MRWFQPKPEPPYAAAMADFSGHVDRLQDGDLMYLRSAWDDLAGPARDAAWAEVKHRIDEGGRQDVAEQLEVGLARWAGAVGRTTGYATWVEPQGLLMERDLRRQALPALWDAGRAILASDLLSAESYATLIDAWRSLFEGPETDEASASGDEPQRS